MKKGKDKIILPSSLWHYTSFEVLTHLLDLSVDSSIYDGNMTFRFSNPLQTNDKKEVHFFKDYVYSTKGGEKLKSYVENLNNTIGMPFTLSLIHHLEKERHYPSCEIPMWRMYGDKFEGVRLRFDFQRLKKHKNWDLIKCQYLTKTQMEKKGREIRKAFQESSDSINLDHLYKEAVCYKTYDWVYENEWRLVLWCNDSNKKCYNPLTGRLYISHNIPLEYLDAVEIGPKADQEAIEGCLLLIKERLQKSQVDAHFKIIKSKLQIGYV